MKFLFSFDGIIGALHLPLSFQKVILFFLIIRFFLTFHSICARPYWHSMLKKILFSWFLLPSITGLLYCSFTLKKNFIQVPWPISEKRWKNNKTSNIWILIFYWLVAWTIITSSHMNYEILWIYWRIHQITVQLILLNEPFRKSQKKS